MRRLLIDFLVALALILESCGGGGTRLASSSTAQASKRASSTEALLEQIAPATTRTWWAVVEGSIAGSDVVRTIDSGRHWHDMWATPTGAIASSAFLNSQVAWIVGWVEQGSARPPPSEPLYRTRNGGQSWQRLTNVPNGCQLDFVDQVHGWCVLISAAAGSEGFDAYRTLDGGSTWTLASSIGPNNPGAIPLDVPFGCDKTITFTSPSVGWISSWCNGGSYYLFTTDDGGSRWQRRQVPLPLGTSTLDEGSGLGRPVAVGDNVAVSARIGGRPETTAIATSADGGLTWATQVVPHPHEPWTVDLIDPTHWMLSDGTLLMATDDAGARWRTRASPVDMKGNFEPLSLKFLSPLVGWAVPDPNGGPLWWTINGGATWRRIVIVASPHRVATS